METWKLSYKVFSFKVFLPDTQKHMLYNKKPLQETSTSAGTSVQYMLVVWMSIER